jgi:hypothetical protein
VLPPAVASDPERLARFDREARTPAALNHPNVAAIYGVDPREGSGDQEIWVVAADGRQATSPFPTRIWGGAIQRGGNRQQYAVAPGGQHFLINSVGEKSAAPPSLPLNRNPRRHTKR